MTFGGWHKILRRTKSLAKPANKPAILCNFFLNVSFDFASN